MDAVKSFVSEAIWWGRLEFGARFDDGKAKVAMEL
jgi:hypothetical protein